MIKWRVITKNLDWWRWPIWDIWVEVPSGLNVKIHSSLVSDLAVMNAIDRLMDVRVMDNYFNCVSYNSNLETVHRAMLHD